MNPPDTPPLDPVLVALQRAFPSLQDKAIFFIALGKPRDLPSPLAAEAFWQSELREWIGQDYAPRLDQVLEAYHLLRPNERNPLEAEGESGSFSIPGPTVACEQR